MTEDDTKSKEEKIKTEKKENLETIIKNILLDRLSHPFIGTFIFSFLTYNYKIILLLIFGLLDKYSYYDTVIENFSNEIGICKPTVYYPLIFAIFIPIVFQNLGDYLIEKSKAFTSRLIANSIENEKKKELIYKNTILTGEIEENKNKFYELLSVQKVYKEFIVKLFNQHTPGKSVEVLIGEVGLSDNCYISKKENGEITIYNRHSDFLGKIISTISGRHYLIERLTPHQLGVELNNQLSDKIQKLTPDQVIYIYASNSKKSYEFSYELNSSNQFLGSIKYNDKKFTQAFPIKKSNAILKHG
ncbi:hypothetical protein [Leptospira levettii]|uniref:hypothetical protein n=1 Tax=Leptospira levettii TaxID=2023178 RepID=UPI00223CBFEF|nr:hypothetical protein [Leptospira levettii]MCW7467781.1 hypothetical protein [Leptospira levettii]MCW7472599.1 hypothetical protein [Leptospira levettii]